MAVRAVIRRAEPPRRTLPYVAGGEAREGPPWRLTAALLGAALCLGAELRATEPSCIHELVYEPFGGLILLPVEIGDSPPLAFVLDSGSNASTITDRDLAAALDLANVGAGLARGVGRGSVEVQLVRGAVIRCSGETLLETDLVVHHILPLLARHAGRDIHGMLGWELFERYVVEVDPIGHRLLLHDPAGFRYQGSGAILPLRLAGRRALVEARVRTTAGQAVKVHLMVDTGSANTLTLIEGAHRLLRPAPDARRQLTFGIAGEVPAATGRVAGLELGKAAVQDLAVTFVPRSAIPAALSIPDLDGVLGNGVLCRFRTIFDYHGGRLILEPLPK